MPCGAHWHSALGTPVAQDIEVSVWWPNHVRQAPLPAVGFRPGPSVRELARASSVPVVRSALLGIVLLGATAWFASFLGDVRPLRQWLFLDLVKMVSWEAF